MRKTLVAFSALLLVAGAGSPTPAMDRGYSGYANDGYAAQSSIGIFNQSVRQRLDLARLGAAQSSGGVGQASIGGGDAYGIGSGSAYGRGRADSSRRAYSQRRQLDCVYTNGFTVWGDVYGAWTRQKTRGLDDGYKYYVGGPALGFDWSTGGLTVGAATTYNWGKNRNSTYNYNERRTQTWSLMGYAQWNTDLFYVNGTVGYGFNRYKSTRDAFAQAVPYSAWDKYNSHAWNFDAEFGWKFNFSGFRVTPNAGLSYFHDRRGAIDETSSGAGGWAMHSGRRNYHSLELPIGVDLGYEAAFAGALVSPKLHFAWVPELARERGSAGGSYSNGVRWFDDAPRRNRHAFQIGAGVQAKITQALSAHIEYNVELRSRFYEHNLNLGVGFSF